MPYLSYVTLFSLYRGLPPLNLRFFNIYFLNLLCWLTVYKESLFAIVTLALILAITAGMDHVCV